MDLVPLRDLIDAHHQENVRRLDEMNERLGRIEANLNTHKHPGVVAWAALAPLLVSLIVAAGFLL